MRNANRATLIDELSNLRGYTLRIFDQLALAHQEVPYLNIINPPLWELGHLGWFQEYWCLRWRHDRAPRGSILNHADRWFDSAKVPHDSRWHLDLPNLGELRDYLSDTLDACLNKLEHAPDTDEGLYFYRLVLFHEMMHSEALAYTCQTLGVSLKDYEWRLPLVESLSADQRMPEGFLTLGSEKGSGFVFDNEKWAHVKQIDSFEIELQPTSVAEFVQFVRDGGYTNPSWWDAAYFAEIKKTGRSMPIYWSEKAGRFYRRWFGQWVPLNYQEPVMHVSAFEAEAFCRWAGKRLPTEAEWQYAAEREPKFEWGSKVWEWTASSFEAFPGFSADPYKEYSEPWFETHRLVKGGSFVTPEGMLSTKFRNFYTPERSDFFVGFRVCSIV